MIANAFTCTGSYAILILYGIKRTENRSAWPEISVEQIDGKSVLKIFVAIFSRRVENIEKQIEELLK